MNSKRLSACRSQHRVYSPRFDAQRLAHGFAMKTLDPSSQNTQAFNTQALSLGQAQQRIDQCVQDLLQNTSLPTERIQLEEAFGRTLAQDITSAVHVPAHTNSAMDGFAFRMPQKTNAEPTNMRFKLVGESLAGKPFTKTVAHDECIKIMTGALLPLELDTVAPFESVMMDSLGEPKNELTLGQWIDMDGARFKAGDNRRLAGEDIQKGARVLLQGQRLHAASMGLMASLGIAQVEVQALLKVAIFSTGDELQRPGETLKPGMIFDSNRYTLKGLLQGLGCEVIDLGIAADQPLALKHMLLEAAKVSDVIITSGGVSDGDADHTKALMQDMGEVYFWKIAMRPGRPLAFGKIGNSLLFGLPGNPVAVMVTFLSLVRPALLQMTRRQDDPAFAISTLTALCDEPIKKKPGRTEFQRGMTRRNAHGQLCVRLSGHQGSGILSSMVQADCLIVLEHDRADIQAQETVTLWPLPGLI